MSVSIPAWIYNTLLLSYRQNGDTMHANVCLQKSHNSKLVVLP